MCGIWIPEATSFRISVRAKAEEFDVCAGADAAAEVSVGGLDADEAAGAGGEQIGKRVGWTDDGAGVDERFDGAASEHGDNIVQPRAKSSRDARAPGGCSVRAHSNQLRNQVADAEGCFVAENFAGRFEAFARAQRDEH